MKLMADADFLDAVKKRNLEADPSTGEELEKLAKEAMIQPPEVIERVKKLMGQMTSSPAYRTKFLSR